MSKSLKRVRAALDDAGAAVEILEMAESTRTAAEAANAGINERLASVELASIPADDELSGYARSAGEAVFNTWCVQCHGREGGGATGYPTLSDDAWLWGGSVPALRRMR